MLQWRYEAFLRLATINAASDRGGTLKERGAFIMKKFLKVFGNFVGATSDKAEGGKDPIGSIDGDNFSADEILSGLRTSVEEFYQEESDDARAAAAADGLPIRDPAGFAYKIGHTREGVPAPASCIMVTYQRRLGDELLTFPEFIQLLPEPENCGTWNPYRRVAKLVSIDDEGNADFFSLPPDLAEMVLEEWSSYERAYAAEYGKYVKLPHARRRTMGNRIETVDDLSTRQLSEIIERSQGQYTARTLSFLSPDELRSVVDEYCTPDEPVEPQHGQTAQAVSDDTDDADDGGIAAIADDDQEAGSDTADNPVNITEQSDSSDIDTVVDADVADGDDHSAFSGDGDSDEGLIEFVDRMVNSCCDQETSLHYMLLTPEQETLLKMSLDTFYKEGIEPKPARVKAIVKKIYLG